MDNMIVNFGTSCQLLQKPPGTTSRTVSNKHWEILLWVGVLLPMTAALNNWSGGGYSKGYKTKININTTSSKLTSSPVPGKLQSLSLAFISGPLETARPKMRYHAT